MSYFFRLFSVLFIFLSTYLQAGQQVEELLSQMTLEQKIGQLIMLPLRSDLPEQQMEQLCNKLVEYHIGGLICMQGTAEQQIDMINACQNKQPIPLLVSQDAEWGISMRLSNVAPLPRNLTLGAIQNNQLLYLFGKELARQCKQVGVDLDLAPVVDVNNNPSNPVINDRSLGEDPLKVAEKSSWIIKGMQDGGIMACAKHFPGHGDCSVDSHLNLPTIPYDLPHLRKIELYPFAAAIQTGVKCIMMGHLYVPYLKPKKNLSSSLSYPIVTGLLKQEMNFEGLIITDSLIMGAISNIMTPAEAALEALLAGNDILLFSDCHPPVIQQMYEEILPQMVTLIKEAFLNNQLSLKDLDEHVSKILQAKLDLGLFQRKLIAKTSVDSEKLLELKKSLFENAITPLRDIERFIPLLNQGNIAYLQIGGEPLSPFAKKLSQQAQITSFYLPVGSSIEEQNKMLGDLSNFPICLIALIEMERSSSKSYGLTSNLLSFLNRIEDSTRPILCIFGSPYSLRLLPKWPTLVAYENCFEAQEAAAKVFCGQIPAVGQLPIHSP